MATKNIRVNSTHYFIMKISSKLQQIAINNSSDIYFKDFTNKKILQKDFTNTRTLQLNIY